jgi:hypothetical protein
MVWTAIRCGEPLAKAGGANALLSATELTTVHQQRTRDRRVLAN